MNRLVESAESQSVAPHMAALINKGMSRQALQIALDAATEGSDSWNDANFWFMYLLAARMIKPQEAAKIAVDFTAQAKACANYSPQMEGDFHRDAAISLLKAGKLHDATQELVAARKIHANDQNRQAAIQMVYGRIAFVRGFFMDALMFHNSADSLWMDLSLEGKYYDRQWVVNNRYHRLRAACSLRLAPWLRRSDDYADVMQFSHNRRQRIGAQLAYFGGKLGVGLFDRVVEPHFAR